MLRLILRNTRNALLLACILLLICSLERLCRYDFAQIQLASSSSALHHPDGLQVDNFVFWNGMPVWEHHPNNPVSALNFFKAMSSSWGLTTTTTSSRGAGRIRDAEELLDIPEPAPLLPAVVNSNTHNNIMLRRQKQSNKIRNNNETSISEKTKEYMNEDANPSPTNSDPKIGFLLHLSTCNQDEFARWKQVWPNQAKTRPFLFAVMLDSDVEETCISQLESQISSLYTGGTMMTTTTTTTMMRWRVFKDDHRGIGTTDLQTCQHIDSVLRANLAGLEELVYYSPAAVIRNGTSSSPWMRRFLADANVVSEFQCIEQPLQPPPECDHRTVMDCPEFRLSPPEAPQISNVASTTVEVS